MAITASTPRKIPNLLAAPPRHNHHLAAVRNHNQIVDAVDGDADAIRVDQVAHCL